MNSPILRIAVPTPLRRLFDYLPPKGESGPWLPGQRVEVPFGRGKSVGVIVEVADESVLPREKLKHARTTLDKATLLTPSIQRLLHWACDYYHHPPGEVWLGALPVALRKGKQAEVPRMQRWRISSEGEQALEQERCKRAPKQQALLKLLQQEPDGLSDEQLNQRIELWRDPARRLREKGWLVSEPMSCLQQGETDNADSRPQLNDEQRAAVTAIEAGQRGFSPFLLEGVTGSGKTEVYLHAIESVIREGRQALVLVPEIGLTPQLLSRFQHRFGVPIALLHSGLSEGERLCAWLAARSGESPIIIGTRSALFAPLANPGIIIVDEEHDPSLKQQDGFRYSGRDVAVMRAHIEGTPIVLGSATPSLESLHNARRGRFTHLHLSQRAGDAKPPRIRILDMRNQPLEEGLSAPLLKAIEQHLQANGQVLLFLNRRGFAPTLICHECGWVGHCRRCDSHLTYHAAERRLRCHHCGSDQPVPHACPDCGSVDLRPLGQGTERLEQALSAHFPDTKTVRIDRDSTRRKGEMSRRLEQVHSGEGRLLIGTQMIAKGHHFPDVTLVALVNADQGLFSLDFRAGERLAQQVIQVAGRAGRAERPGEVVIQSHQPDHPLLLQLAQHGYPAFADATLHDRQGALLPPFSHMALLRAEAVSKEAPRLFLQQAREQAEALGAEGVMLLGPVPAPMERRAGRYRAQLLLQANERSALHRLLQPWLQALEGMKSGRQVRWSIDIDPQDMF